MKAYDDRELNTRVKQPAANARGADVRTIIITVVVVSLLLGGFYLWANRSLPAAPVETAPVVVPVPLQPEAEAEPLPVQEAPAAELAPVPEQPSKPIVPVAATVDGSDGQVKLAIADLAPGMASWFVSEQQIRKWVLAIDLMADGDVPKQYRPIAYPLVRFEPEVRGVEPEQQFLVKADSYKRTELFVNLFTAMDVQHLARYYRAWLPLLEKAYQEQGKKDKFDQRFRTAVQRVIDVKPLAEAPMLKKRGGVIYVYADEKLEAATDVEKMMWRMGPDNSLKLQNYLKELQQHLLKK